MKTLITILFSLFLANYSFASIVFYKTQLQCEQSSVNLTESEKSRHYCFVNPNPTQCESDELAKYQAKETAKYKARNNQNPPIDYFDATSTLGKQTGSSNNNLLVYGGLGSILLSLVVWVVNKLRK